MHPADLLKLSSFQKVNFISKLVALLKFIVYLPASADAVVKLSVSIPLAHHTLRRTANVMNDANPPRYKANWNNEENRVIGR